jgi:hypothetical protein
MNMNMSQNKTNLQLFMQMFVNRTDIYAVQYATRDQHGYRAVRSFLGLALIEEHLAGKLTLGVYALSASSTAKWMVVDLDTTDISKLQDVLRRATDMMLPDPVIEFSGRRGYHFWWFFKEPVSGWQARKLGLAVAGEHEVFPKQGNASRDTSRPGSLVKAPLGIHQVSRQWSCFLNRDLEKVPDAWTLLRTVERVDISRYAHVVRRDSPKAASLHRPLKTIDMVRPCIEKVLRDGAKLGKRNETGHLIACEMRRLGRSKEEAAGVLACWNLRNEPRLARFELQVVLESAYGNKTYSYGCSPDGQLRMTLECIGEKDCPIADFHDDRGMSSCETPTRTEKHSG